MTRLQRHPLAMRTHFRDVLVLTYAVPAVRLAPLVPDTLDLETRGDLGFVAVALVDMQRLRPAGLPPWTGSDAVFVGYRVVVRAELAAGRSRRGLKVIRTDVNRLHLLAGTRLLTRYDAGLVAARWQRDDADQRVTVRARRGGADLDVHARLDDPAAPPAGSPFATWLEAAPFSGPLPWTFAPAGDGRALAVKGVRSDWRPRPVTVHAHAVGLFDAEPFAGSEPVLAAAFHVADVDYTWQAGRLEALRAPEHVS